MPLSVPNAINPMLDHLATLIEEASLHTDNPGPAGLLNEVAGGAPAYARKAITFAAAAAGNLDVVNQPVFDVPEDTTVSWFAFWSSDGTYRGSGQLAEPQPFGVQGTYTLTDADINGVSA